VSEAVRGHSAYALRDSGVTWKSESEGEKQQKISTLHFGKIIGRKMLGTTTKHRGRCADPGGWAVAREPAAGSPQGETPRDGANQNCRMAA
jgi:hypothetical protein